MTLCAVHVYTNTSKNAHLTVVKYMGPLHTQYQWIIIDIDKGN